MGVPPSGGARAGRELTNRGMGMRYVVGSYVVAESEDESLKSL